MSKKTRPDESRVEVGRLSALEALLASIVKGYAPRGAPAHSTRVRRAMQLLTGIDIKRPDPYETSLTAALRRMWQLRYDDYKAQISPEFGGSPASEPVPQERSVRELALQVCRELGLRADTDADVLQRKFSGNYAAIPEAIRMDYLWAHATAVLPDASAEADHLRRDLLKVAQILAAHGVQMDIGKVF